MKIIKWFKAGFQWLKVSNRWKHLVGGYVIGLLSNSDYCALYASFVGASCLELKDKNWGGVWDWIDWVLTIAGGMLGRLTHAVVWGR